MSPTEKALRLSTVLSEREQRMYEALMPFAKIVPSSLFRPDGADGETYGVFLARRLDEADFNGKDIARARAVLASIDAEVEKHNADPA